MHYRPEHNINFAFCVVISMCSLHSTKGQNNTFVAMDNSLYTLINIKDTVTYVKKDEACAIVCDQNDECVGFYYYINSG